MTAHWTVLVGLILSFTACFILLVIAPLDVGDVGQWRP